jgi:hypothetical protein
VYDNAVQDEYPSEIEFHLSPNSSETSEQDRNFNHTPATQFPTPALKDWSSRSALMGHFRFVTFNMYSSKDGRDRRGSKPRDEMGGSVRGEGLNLTLPSRLASEYANSFTSSDEEVANRKTNYKCSIASRSISVNSDLGKLWRPGSRICFLLAGVLMRGRSFGLLP